MSMRFPDDRFVKDAMPHGEASSQLGDAVSEGWSWVGERLAAHAQDMAENSAALDRMARQADSFDEWQGLKALAAVYGVAGVVVRTPPAVVYGTADFALKLVQSPTATLKSVPPAFQELARTFFQGGRHLLKGNLAQGLAQTLEPAINGFLMVAGGVGMLKGAARAGLAAARDVVAAAREMPMMVGENPFKNLIPSEASSVSPQTFAFEPMPLMVWGRFSKLWDRMARMWKEHVTGPRVSEAAKTSDGAVETPAEPRDAVRKSAAEKPVEPGDAAKTSDGAVDDVFQMTYDQLLKRRSEREAMRAAEKAAKAASELKLLNELLARDVAEFTPAELTDLLRLAREYPDARPKLKQLARSEGGLDLFNGEHLQMLVQLTDVSVKSAMVLGHLAHSRSQLFTGSHLQALLDTAKKSNVALDNTTAVVCELAKFRPDLFTTENIAPLTDLAMSSKDAVYALARVAMRRPDLAELALEGVIEVAKNYERISARQEATQFAISVLKQIREKLPQFTGQVIHGLCEAAARSDLANKVLVELIADRPEAFTDVHLLVLIEDAHFLRSLEPVTLKHLLKARSDLLESVITDIAQLPPGKAGKVLDVVHRLDPKFLDRKRLEVAALVDVDFLLNVVGEGSVKAEGLLGQVASGKPDVFNEGHLNRLMDFAALERGFDVLLTLAKNRKDLFRVEHLRQLIEREFESHSGRGVDLAKLAQVVPDLFEKSDISSLIRLAYTNHAGDVAVGVLCKLRPENFSDGHVVELASLARATEMRGVDALYTLAKMNKDLNPTPIIDALAWKAATLRGPNARRPILDLRNQRPDLRAEIERALLRHRMLSDPLLEAARPAPPPSGPRSGPRSE